MDANRVSALTQGGYLRSPNLVSSTVSIRPEAAPDRQSGLLQILSIVLPEAL